MAAKDTAKATPTHVAVIMDGNGRWARQHGRHRLAGHKRGAERAREVVEACPDLGIDYMTLYAFSTENWKRSTREVLGLMSLFGRYIRREADRLSDEGVRMRIIGDRTRIDPKLQRLFSWIESRTRHNDRLHLQVAINYGGRNEIMRATRRVAEAVARGEIAADAIDEATIAAHLDTAGLPDPDLVIRTSGETRISNYLLWQSAYAEYEFTDTLWPDFTAEKLADIVTRFHQRDRRFGAVR